MNKIPLNIRKLIKSFVDIKPIKYYYINKLLELKKKYKFIGIKSIINNDINTKKFKKMIQELREYNKEIEIDLNYIHDNKIEYMFLKGIDKQFRSYWLYKVGNEEINKVYKFEGDQNYLFDWPEDWGGSKIIRVRIIKKRKKPPYYVYFFKLNIILEGLDGNKYIVKKINNNKIWIKI